MMPYSLPIFAATFWAISSCKAMSLSGLYPQIKVMILTFHREKDYLHQAMLNGVDGYILKKDIDQELYSAIQAVRRGKVYISPLLEANS